MMKAQEAAYEILVEHGRPLRSREIAQIAFDRGIVSSTAADPVFSISSTIDKNIRNDRYNSPRLVFVQERDGRKIGLPEMSEAQGEDGFNSSKSRADRRRLTVELTSDLVDQIQLASQARLADSYNDTVALLLKAGLSNYASEIRELLLVQLDQIEGDMVPGTRRNSGQALNQEWNVGAAHALYHKDGNWYHLLDRFPGAYFDPRGYVLFRTEEEYRNCGYLEIGEHVHVRGDISKISGYNRVR